MISGLKIAMKNYVNKPVIIMCFVVFSVAPICEGKTIKANLVENKSTISTLSKEVKKMTPAGTVIEYRSIAFIKEESHLIYIVPVFINDNEESGCFIYEFGKNLDFKKRILLSKLQETESCEMVATVFSCNRDGASSPGIGILYGKKLGFDHYWFEGSYLTLDSAGNLVLDQARSELLTDVETAANARKKLHCR